MFEWWQYDFMRSALWAVLLIMPLFTLLGAMVVSNGMAFFSDALGHSALTGAGLGVLLGASSLEWPMVLFAVAFALLMNAVRRSRLSSTDTIISVFSSCGVALGLIILSKGGGFARYQNLLIGDILSIAPHQLAVLGAALVMTLLVWLLLFNQMYAVSVSPAMAKSKGIPVRLLDDLFVILVAVVVMLAIRWVGLLMINAMLILPAAAARNLANNLSSYHGISLLFGLFSGIAGLITSYYLAIPTGPTIVFIACILFFGSFLMRNKA